MTQEIFNQLTILTKVLKSRPSWFNDYNRRFAKDRIAKFASFGDKTIMSEKQTKKLDALIKELDSRAEEEVLG